MRGTLLVQVLERIIKTSKLDTKVGIKSNCVLVTTRLPEIEPGSQFGTRALVGRG